MGMKASVTSDCRPGEVCLGEVSESIAQHSKYKTKRTVPAETPGCVTIYVTKAEAQQRGVEIA